MPDPTPDTPGSLHSQIMALPIETDAYNDEPTYTMLRSAFADGAAAMRHAAASLVAGHETPQQAWISVDERLPKQYETVLALDDYRDMQGSAIIATARMDDGTWLNDGRGKLHRVTHWQPLPAPPVTGAPAGGGEQGGEGGFMGLE